MRILVLGAGAIGGYFGGRLVEKGEDVTFLVREQRKENLQKNALKISSIHGDFTFQPKVITTKDDANPFDIVLFSTKSYHITEAIDDVKPYIGEQTVIIPLLNGIAHVDMLQKEFGEEKVIGGLCFIETTLNNDGDVIQTSPVHRLVYGEFKNHDSERIQKVSQVFSGTKAIFVKSDQIEQEMWHKYLFIATMSGITSLMRSPIGPIRDSEGGLAFIQSLLEEIASIMRENGAPIRDNIVDQHMDTMKKQTYSMKTSMQRDMEKGTFIEGDHLQGYLLQLADKYKIEAPLLKIIYQNLKVYEISKKLEA